MAYAVVAALVAGLAVTLTPILKLPAWTDEAVIAGLAVFFALAVWLAWAASAPAGQGEPPRPSKAAGMTIAILPFANLSQSVEDEVFADGMVKDLITGLAMNSTLKVISRSSTFAYKGASPDVRAVAADLGCDFVLEGSVRRLGERLRVSVQLIDGANGAHVWVERYDQPLKDLFALQDELIRQIALALGDAVIDAEFARLRRDPTSVSAWAETMRAFLALERPSLESAAKALEHARRAVALDPGFALGQARLGSAYMTLGQLTGGEAGKTMRQEGSAAIDRALDLAPNDAKILTLAAGQMGFYGRAEEAIRHGERARALNPNDSHAIGALANAYFGAGRWADAAALYEEEARLAPRAVMLVSHAIVHSIACMMLGELDRAEGVLRRCLDIDPGVASTWAVIALLELLRGDTAAAVEAVSGLRRVEPRATVDQMAAGLKANVPSPDIDQLVAEFRQAWAASGDT